MCKKLKISRVIPLTSFPISPLFLRKLLTQKVLGKFRVFTRAYNRLHKNTVLPGEFCVLAKFGLRKSV